MMLQGQCASMCPYKGEVLFDVFLNNLFNVNSPLKWLDGNTFGKVSQGNFSKQAATLNICKHHFGLHLRISKEAQAKISLALVWAFFVI